MLCKTTMRAALAHVLATVGILGAFGAGAAPDDPYASESISGDAPYAIKGSPMGEILLEVKLDTLLDAATYYLAVNFWDAQLTKQLDLTYTENMADTAGTQGDPNADPPTAAVQPVVGTGTGFRFYTVTPSVRASATGVTPVVVGVDGSISATSAAPHTDVTLTRAFRGDATDTSGAYRMVVGGDGLPIDTYIRLELGSNLAITSKGAKSYRGDLYIYEDLGDARAAARASAPGDVPDNHLFSAYNKLFEVKSKITAPSVVGYLATADVGYTRAATLDDDDNVEISNGGPFRGFEPNEDLGTTKDVGLLAMITLNQAMDNPATRMVDEGAFLNAADGQAYTGNPNTGARVKVEAVAGAFGFGNGAGQNLVGNRGEAPIMGDNPATMDMVETDHTIHAGGAPRAFRIATAGAACTGGSHLVLATADGAINPTADTNATFSADATEGSAEVGGPGPFYLCVNVSENEVEIPAVGDDRDKDGYKITVTPLHGKSPGPAKVENAGGAIDKNGASINITYLSLDPSYDQRLVIVNRSMREADFWMTEFQTEEGTMISGEIRGTVGAMSRMVVNVQNVLMTNMGGENRASGTLNLTAPTGNVDVMTVQSHPGTGQIDTTMYGNGGN